MNEITIEWLDSSTFDGWFDSEGITILQPYICTTKGFLVAEDDTCYKVVSTIAQGELKRYCSGICIPKGCVIKYVTK